MNLEKAETIHPHSRNLLDRLVGNAIEHGLVLFVGAGVNPTSTPKWGDLLGTLLDEALDVASTEDESLRKFRPRIKQWCMAHFDVCALASVIRRLLGPRRYREEIKSAIYRRSAGLEKAIKNYCSRRWNKEHPTETGVKSSENLRAGEQDEPNESFEFLYRVAELCSRPEVMGVATFNFDTYLEAAIAGCGQKTPRAHFGDSASITVESSPITGIFDKRTLPVFHVHGLLSPPDTLLRNPDEGVVFSYEEYFDKNANPLSWETSTPIHLLRNFCTLWVGASIKDWNMMRLLHAAHTEKPLSRSYCLQCLKEANPDHALTPISIDKNPNAIREQCEREKSELLLPEDFRQFRKAAMRLQATLYEALGMDLILAGPKYSDLPTTINKNITIELERRSQSHVKKKYREKESC